MWTCGHSGLAHRYYMGCTPEDKCLDVLKGWIGVVASWLVHCDQDDTIIVWIIIQMSKCITWKFDHENLKKNLLILENFSPRNVPAICIIAYNSLKLVLILQKHLIDFCMNALRCSQCYSYGITGNVLKHTEASWTPKSSVGCAGWCCLYTQLWCGSHTTDIRTY